MSIRFSPCTPAACDLLSRTGFSWRGALAFPDECTRVCCFDLADIVTQNNLTPLNCLRNSMGVYMVVEGDTALYVGSCAKVTADWNLRERIAQHFRKKDSGATLWKNWERMNRGCDFTQFLARMQSCRLQVVSFGSNACEQEILRLEHLLIGLLGPRYCDVSEPTPRSADS